MNKLPVHISAGNTKMGAIPSFFCLPVRPVPFPPAKPAFAKAAMPANWNTSAPASVTLMRKISPSPRIISSVLNPISPGGSVRPMTLACSASMSPAISSPANTSICGCGSSVPIPAPSSSPSPSNMILSRQSTANSSPEIFVSCSAHGRALKCLVLC